MIAWVDADWADDEETRYSISGVIVTAGDSAIYSSSRRQRATALSPREAEYFSATQGAADLLHICEVMKFFGVKARGRTHTDSSACIGMASRRGSAEFDTWRPEPFGSRMSSTTGGLTW